MQNKDLHTTQQFFVVGISYQKADAAIRGLFSLPFEKQKLLLQAAKARGLVSISVLSTCNRTEIYGLAANSNVLIDLLVHFTHGSVELFRKVGYILKEEKAISHIFEVGTGINSQILGDFEIISQLRSSFKLSKSLGLLQGDMERLINEVIRASKQIKNETQLSNGATSVSFAAVQYIRARVPNLSEKKILLFGLGKIGRNTCENLIKHTQNKHITLINRTKIKAEKVAGKFKLNVVNYNYIQEEITQTDVLVVATGAQMPTITKQLLFLKKPLLILDLSIPKNVATNVTENPLVTLVHLDELSVITQQTLEERKKQLPKALAIIKEIKNDYFAWHKQRVFAPTIKALKEKLQTIKEGELDFQSKNIENFNATHATILADRLIQKITTQVVNHLKNNNNKPQTNIEVIKKMFELDPN